jgi:hypothetical protein
VVINLNHDVIIELPHSTLAIFLLGLRTSRVDITNCIVTANHFELEE